MTGDSTIAVHNVVPGAGAVVIHCDVELNGVRICSVSLRRGRHPLSTYVNLPHIWRAGRWWPAVEIVDNELLEAVRRAVVNAALEVQRYLA